MKKSIALVLAASVMMSGNAVMAQTTQTYSAVTVGSSEYITAGIGIVVDGTSLDLTEVEAEISDGRVYVPLKFICEALGLDVSWDGTTQTVTVGNKFTHVVGKSYVTLSNGTQKDVQSNSFIKDGRTMVSVRLFAEAIGAGVTWDSSSRTVYISTDGAESSVLQSTSTTEIDTTTSASVSGSIEMAKPSGEPPTDMSQGGNAQSGTPPIGNPPSGMQQSGERPSGEPPSGEPPTGTNQMGNPPSGERPEMPSTTGTNTSGSTTNTESLATAVYKLSTGTGTKSSVSYDATDENQSGVWVLSGAKATLSSVTVTKTGDTSDVESSDFYGLNGAILVSGAGNLTLSDSTVTSDAEGANAVVATGKNSKITLDDVNITTSENSSRGLHATAGGTITATDVTITTKGDHSAALATDRGSGTVTLTSGTLSTAGDGSPGIYSTGTIKATNITSVATGSEAAVIEGRNSITLTDSSITGYKKCGVMIYQSFSGDAEVGKGVFTMTNGSITSKVGPMFYSTNTQAEVNLTNVSLYNTTSELIELAAGDWGTDGSNGATMIFNASNQTLTGSIEVDDISSLTLNLKDGSYFTGTIDEDNTAKYIKVTLDSDSELSLTADSYIDVLIDDDSSLSNIIGNGYNLYYDADASGNEWLDGETISLTDGGVLMPIE